MLATQALLFYTRPGFEKDLAAELQQIFSDPACAGYVNTSPDTGYVYYVLFQPVDAEDLNRAYRLENIVFARQGCMLVQQQLDLPQQDRLQPLLACLQQMDLSFYRVSLDMPDTNQGKSLSAFFRKFRKPLDMALESNGLINPDSPWQCHLFFTDSGQVSVGISHRHNTSPWHLGIPRLRMPSGAPSRSTLKLEEAILTLFSEAEQSRLFHNGMMAVDLGAAPGGWTWQLVKRNMLVTAVDNGPMDQALMDSGLVKHQRADGFKFEPARPVDWLVCDMVERPLHIARLMSRWVTQGWCRHAIFNLKLPMKQRYQIVAESRALILENLQQHNIQAQLRMKQLYHDREEITCALLRT